MRDRKAEFETAKILAMMANCASTEESLQKAGKPEGYLPSDFMPESEVKEAGMTMKEWVLALEAGQLDGPATEEEKANIALLNKKMTNYLKQDRVGKVKMQRVE